MGKNSIAVDTLERLAMQYQGITEAAVQLREIGSHEDVIAELQLQRETLLKEVQAAKNELAHCHHCATEKASFAEEIEASANQRAIEIIEEAKTKAAQIVTAAEKKASDYLDTHRSKHEATLQESQAQIDAEKENLIAWQEKTAEAIKQAEAIERRTLAAQKSLEKIQAQARALTGL